MGQVFGVVLKLLVGLSVFHIRGPGLRSRIPDSSFLWCALGEAVVARSTGFLSLMGELVSSSRLQLLQALGV